MSTVGVIIGTYGDLDVWGPLVQRAMRSVENQTLPVDLCRWSHGRSLQEARNRAAERIGTDWLIFLDADDELDPCYVEEMLWGLDGSDVYAPRTLGVYEDGTTDDGPVRIPTRDLRVANYVVIGAMQRRDLFLEVGGFPDYPILEDWALWRRLKAAGAAFSESPAIYRVHVRPESRNQDQVLHSQVYRQIQREIPL